MGGRLAEYASFGTVQQKANPQGWKRLEVEYKDLPAELTENAVDSQDWLDSEAWIHFEFGAFFGAFASFNAAAETADRQQAYVDMVEDRDAAVERYQAALTHATTVHKASAKLAIDALKLLLARKPEEVDSAELDERGQEQAQTHLDAIEQVLDEIKKHVEQRRGDAHKLDKADGGHSVARHGPELPLEKISKRVTTGYAPDGKWSPYKKSGQFLNYDLQIETREAAFVYAETYEGADFGPNRDKPPLPGSAPFAFTVAHGKQVGRGFQGTGPAKTVPGKSGEIYATVVATVLNNTYTKIKWDEAKTRWVAIQHFPS